MKKVILFGLFCLACTPPDPLPDGGTPRIVPRRYLTSEGTQFPATVPEFDAFDTKLGQPCKWRLAEDGSTRCLPQMVPPLGLGYLDSACNIPVWSHDSSVYKTTPAYGVIGLPFEAIKVFRLNTPSIRPTSLYVLMGGGACGLSGPASIELEYYTGTPVKADSFVSAVLVP